MFMILQSQKDGTSNVEEKLNKLASQKADLEKQVHVSTSLANEFR